MIKSSLGFWIHQPSYMERSSRLSGSIWTSLVFFGLLGALIFTQLFITYRGLKSPAAMEQAHIAKQIASGQGFTTKIIRPSVWYELDKNARPVSSYVQPDLTQPPLPSLLLVPVMGLFKDFWIYEEGTSIYILDRVVTIVSVLFYIGALIFIWLTLFRLFDQKVAGWSLMCVVVSNIFWGLATEGIAQMMTLFFFCLAMYLQTLATEKELDSQKPAFMNYLMMGIALALMVMCNYYSFAIVIGLSVALAIFSRQKGNVLVILAPSLLALTLMAWRYYSVSGQPFGAYYAVLKSALTVYSDLEMIRTFGEVSNLVDSSFLLRKLLMSISVSLGSLYVYFGGIIPALLFFVAVLHSFRNPTTARMHWVLIVSFILVTLQLAFFDMSGKEKDDRQIFSNFAPICTGFGVAFLLVLWSRIGRLGRSWMAENAGILVALFLTAIPLMSILPIDITLGIVAKGQLNHYPDYVPERIRRLQDLVPKEDVIFADVPWATAWYADRSSIWLPVHVADFQKLKAINESKKVRTAGMYFSPYSARVDRIGDLFHDSNLNEEWAMLIFRGFAGGFGVDTIVHSDFPFKISIPVIGKQLSDGRYVADTVFFTDKMSQK